jgi:ABC-type glycerol-3-phosphate transport system substrate-binding protein
MNPLKIITITLLIGLATGILALGPRSGKRVPEDCVVVDYWEKWTGTEERQMREIVDDFNRTVGAEKRIYVNYVSTSNIAQKTLVACAAGVPPDVAGLWSRSLIQFALVGALEPLEEGARAHGITEATYKPICWKTCTMDGHLYALVSTPAAVALIWNKKLFAQRATELRAAGLDPERAPRTLDELDAYAKVLTKLDERGRFIVAGYLPTEPGWYLDQTHLWFGGRFWDADNKRFTLTDERVVKAFEWVQSYSTRYGKQATSDFRSGAGHFDSPQNPFLAGTVAMVLQGPWMANVIYKAKPGMSTVRW